jgi:hypothetical protein
MKKHLLASILAVILAGGAAFYGGMTFAATKAPTGSRQGGQGQQGTFQRGAGGAGFRGGAAGGANGGFTNGEVLSKDDKSITLKMRDGGSKIVFYTNSTAMSKMAPATIADIAVGKQVMVTGTANSDGSITAQMLQLRPDMPQGATSTGAAPTTPSTN